MWIIAAVWQSGVAEPKTITATITLMPLKSFSLLFPARSHLLTVALWEFPTSTSGSNVTKVAHFKC